jgi:hypothetical protein
MPFCHPRFWNQGKANAPFFHACMSAIPPLAKLIDFICRAPFLESVRLISKI